MESTSLDDVRLLRDMINEHEEEIRQERARLEALRLEWTRANLLSEARRPQGKAKRAEPSSVASLRQQIDESERSIARTEELLGILRRKQHSL